MADVGHRHLPHPIMELHIRDGDSPAVRLEQDWLLWLDSLKSGTCASNESNFFIRDATNGSKLPFRIHTQHTHRAPLFLNSRWAVCGHGHQLAGVIPSR